MPRAEIQIVPVTNSSELRAFIHCPRRIYRNDPHWIPPLDKERKDFLNPKKNPFFRHATVRLFLAVKDGVPVGRISAQVDHLHEKHHGEKVGFFGMLESEADPEISRRLFGAAEAYLRELGCELARGPFSLSINQESGLLIEGFEEALMTMTPYNPPYYADLVEDAGYRKAKDLFAWRYEAGPVAEGPLQIARAVEQFPGLTIRPFDPKKSLRDTAFLFEVFNSAWSHNWGFVPATEEEIRHTATELKQFADPRLIFLAEVNGEPAGICLTVPNFYELIDGLNGKLFPFGFLKLLYRLKRGKSRTSRLMLLGIKKEFRGSALGGLSVLLYVKVAEVGTAIGKIYGELSWTLEDNEKINTGIEFMGGRKFKIFRIYEKDLGK